MTLTASPMDPEAPAPDRRRRDGRGPAIALLLLTAVLFLGYGSRTIAAPFGDAHDGRNAGVWASGSQALREEGPIASRLGTDRPVSGVYANHPPLIAVETAVAEVVGTPAPAASRAPAWLGSLAVIALLALLLREGGMRRGAVGVAVLLALTTPMFLVYGTMLDTPVTSLPFGLGLLVLWERARRGDPVRPLLAGGLAALAALAGWQALLLALALAGWALVRIVRGTGRREVNLAFAGGAALGAMLLLGWLLWAFGGTVQPLLDQFLFRTGESTQPVSLSELFAAHRGALTAMLGVIGLLGVGGLVLAARDARTRGLVAVSLAVTVPYSLVFRTGVVNHEYWGYWFLLPVALGLATGVDRLLAYWQALGRPEIVPTAVAAVMASLSVLVAWQQPPSGESLKITGFRATEAVDAVQLDPRQRTAWFAAAVGEPASWLSRQTGRPAVAVLRADYADLAVTHPLDLVLIGEVRCTAEGNDHTYEMRPARTLMEQPPVVKPC